MKAVSPCAFGALVAMTLTSPVRAGDLDGRWALVQSTATIADVPVAGRIHARTTVVSFHDLVSTETSLRGAGTLCSIAVDSGTSLARTVLPPALRRALPSPSFDANLAVVNGRLTLFQAPAPIVLGARLGRLDEPLPSEVADTRVFDQDEDGSPGVTVRIEGIVSGEMHLVQRTWVRLDGTLRVDGTFGGIVRHGLTQSVLDATSPFLRSPPRAAPAPAMSWFRLGRIGRTGGCAEATRAAEAWSR